LRQCRARSRRAEIAGGNDGQLLMAFQFTPKQLEAQQIIAGDATHVMLFGGSRSGKTFLNVRNVVMRALKAPGSRHAILRFRFNHVKQSIILDTFPKVMQLCFPGVPYEVSKTDWYAKINGSEIWFGGLDDKERTEKLLGLEFATIYLNECSQISWAAREMVMTRLAQLVMQKIEGLTPEPLRLRVYYDCNPPSKAHWTFRLFKQKTDPETHEPLRNPADYVSFQMNPRDNVQNLSPEYLEKTLGALSARMRRRFMDGEFADATPNALFDEGLIDRWRVLDGVLPDFVRVVVAVDPSGSGDTDNADNDEIGIVVGGLGTDGNAYLIEDCTIKAGPATWGKVATDAFERHDADTIVGETNFGGDMVRATIQTTRARTPFKKVTASRGKVQRAEPFSALYEQGKVRHVGILARLEDELCAFSTTGYTGAGSPNRADAAIWALAELFPAIVAGPAKEKKPREAVHRGAGAWMS
jgi:phage terminase large subunit-like protein